MADTNTISINGKPVTEKELRVKREEVKAQRGVKLVEVAPNQFKIQIQG